MKNLKVAYNNSLRGLLAYLVIIVIAQVVCIRKYVYNFRNRLEINYNFIIRGMYLSHFPLQSGIWDLWRDILSPYLEHRSVYITVFYLFFNNNLYNICIICKLLYGLCFRNKHNN